MALEDIFPVLRPYLLSIIVVIATIIFSRLVSLAIKRNFALSSKKLKVDPTNYAFFRHIVSATIYVVGFALAVFLIPGMKTLGATMFAGAGVLAIIVGFASQHAFANIVSGVFIVIFKPFRIGDRIQLGSDEPGIVEDITLRHTIIRTFQNKRVIVPNSVISVEKIENSNLEDNEVCKYVDFGISYDSDIDKAMSIMEKEALKHPLCIDRRSKEDVKKGEKQVAVRLLSFGDSSVNLRAWVWTNSSSDAFVLGCDLNKSIKHRFDKAGIEIPFPHRTIVMKK